MTGIVVEADMKAECSSWLRAGGAYMSSRDCETILIFFLFARVYRRDMGFILFYLFFNCALAGAR